MNYNKMKIDLSYNINQNVIRGYGSLCFQSYDSIVAVIDSKGNLTLGTDWDYSKTTLKYLYMFLYDYKHIFYLEHLEGCSNKRAKIQSMIDQGLIGYDKNLI